MSRSGLHALVHVGGSVAGSQDAAAGDIAHGLVRAGCEVTVLDVADDAPAAVAQRIEVEDAERRLDLVVAADIGVLGALAQRAGMRGRLWMLTTQFPSRLDLVAGAAPAIGEVVAAARWVLCPDEVTRGVLDATVPDAAARTAVLPLGGTLPGAEAGLGSGLEALLDRTFPASAYDLNGASRPRRVVVAGHDLKFITGVIEHLEALPGVELRVERVAALGRLDEAAHRAHVEWADVVICEWCNPVAIWYSRHKRPGQRIVVRLHRVELYTDWPAELDIDAVDQVVCVSPHYARLTLDRTGWPAEKVAVVPNYVDTRALDRPKLPGARFHLGMLGIVPRRKRLDLAVDVLERLRRRDARYTLFVKTRMPWEVYWSWREPDEREHIRTVLQRIRRSGVLHDGVVFDPHGGDVAAWLRKIGFVLSTSEDESFHLAPAEGMTSGAVPALLDWPGVRTIYDPSWVHADAIVMAEAIDDIVRGGRWEELRERARLQARASFDLSLVCEQFVRLLTENLPPAHLDGTLTRPDTATLR